MWVKHMTWKSLFEWPDYEGTELTKRDCEMYVKGMWDLFWLLGGEEWSKSYDPLKFSDPDNDREYVSSYVLEFEDRGRHHPFRSVEDVAWRALLETAKRFETEFPKADFKWNRYFRENIEKIIEQNSHLPYRKKEPDHAPASQ